MSYAIVAIEITAIGYFAIGFILHMIAKWNALQISTPTIAPVSDVDTLYNFDEIQWPTPSEETVLALEEIANTLVDTIADQLDTIFADTAVPSVAIAHDDLDTMTLQELRALPLAAEVPNADRLNTATLRKRLKALL